MDFSENIVPICTDSDIKDALSKYFDQNEFLGKDNLERIDLYLFALGYGYHKGKRTPLKASTGLVRGSILEGHPEYMAIIQAIHLHELRLEGKDDTTLVDSNEGYRIANEYANTGFHELLEKLKAPDFNDNEFRSELIENLMDINESVS